MAVLTRSSCTSRNANSNGNSDTSDDVPIEIEPTGQPDLNTQNNTQANKDVDDISVSVSQSQTESRRAQTPIPAESASKSQESSQAAKKRKLTSVVWQHFRKIEEGGVAKAQCNYCNLKLSAASSGGTNHLNRHSLKCLAESGAVIDPKQTLLGFTSHSKTPVNAVWIFSREKTLEKLAKMIIQHKYPFAI
ncbi:hypothetical protein PCANC_19657, partial [Puccinia coronata f. sp. avenae]